MRDIEGNTKTAKTRKHKRESDLQGQAFKENHKPVFEEDACGLWFGSLQDSKQRVDQRFQPDTSTKHS